MSREKNKIQKIEQGTTFDMKKHKHPSHKGVPFGLKRTILVNSNFTHKRTFRVGYQKT